MKKLIVVESPAKIKTISKFLGKDYTIVSTLGHVKDLPENSLGVTLDDDVTIDYVVLDKKDSVIATICKEARKADEIFLAPDPDREGEIIAWHVAQEVEKVVDPSKIRRITFNEITKQAITDALTNPRTIDIDKVRAQQARRVLDRLVGYEVSPVLWKKLAKGLSAGRVQSVALRLICDREEGIRTFKAEEYWTIEGLFTGKSGQLTAELALVQGKKFAISSKEQAEKLVVESGKQSYIVDAIKDSKRLKNPNAPFMTSTLQQAAYNRLGFSVQKTMQLAQKLYEGVPLEDSGSPVALITYMRTDSLRLSDTAVEQARGFIKRTYGPEYLPTTAQVYAKGKAQDAHEAIRPIDVAITPDHAEKYLEKGLSELYRLIWQRFVACQMKPAQYAQRQVTIIGGDYTFKVTGSSLLFDGFLSVYKADEEDEAEKNSKIPADLAQGAPLKLSKTDPKQHFTQPPPRYTEASLVKDLEKEGIGRPSTYATIMKTIQARSYTSLDSKKRFVPTELGMAVTKMLVEHLPKIMNVKFTALMEEDLDKIAAGDMDRDVLLKSFYTMFEKDLEKFRGSSKAKQSEKTTIDCPECKQGKLLIRFGKAGSFLGCERYPDCGFTSNFERDSEGNIVLTAAAGPELLEEKCPNCGKNLRRIVGRFGPFIACSGYPECKYIHQETAKFPCPVDGGAVIKRSWKGKIFWGCKNYPKCTFSISGDIVDTPCPSCKSPYLSIKKLASGTEYVCTKPECGYRMSADSGHA
jgi:DNA topoisomerase-1